MGVIIDVQISKLSLNPIYSQLMATNEFTYTQSEVFLAEITLPVVVQTGKTYQVIHNARSYLINFNNDLLNKHSEGKNKISVIQVNLTEEQIRTSIVLDIFSSSLKGKELSTQHIAELLDVTIADKQLSSALVNTLGVNSITAFIKSELHVNYQSCIKAMKNKSKRQKVQLQKVFCKNESGYDLIEFNYTKIKGNEYINLLLNEELSETLPIDRKSTLNIRGNEYRFLTIDNYDFLIDTDKKAVSYFIPKLEIVLFLTGENKAVIKSVTDNSVQLHECSVLLRESKNSINYEYKSVQYSSMKRKILILPIYAISKLKESGYDV